MSRNIRLPARFKSWAEYGDTYGVDVVPEVWVMRCRECGAQWAMRHNHGKLARQMHRGCPNECNGPRKDRRSQGTLPPMLARRLDELIEWRGVRNNRDERYKYDRPEVRSDEEDEWARMRADRRRAFKKEQREWFAKVRAGWRPLTAAEKIDHVRAQMEFLDELGGFPDPMRVLFAQEHQPGRDLMAFLDRWRDREDWS